MNCKLVFHAEKEADAHKLITMAYGLCIHEEGFKMSGPHLRAVNADGSMLHSLLSSIVFEGEVTIHCEHYVYETLAKGFKSYTLPDFLKAIDKKEIT